MEGEIELGRVPFPHSESFITLFLAQSHVQKER